MNLVELKCFSVIRMAYDPYGLYRAAPHPASVYPSASYAAAAYSHYGGSYPTHAHSNPYAQGWLQTKQKGHFERIIVRFFFSNLNKEIFNKA